jgi:flagellin
MRIGSNSSRLELTAQNNLLNALSELSLSSVRLSTMQRINRGSDDPAGLIAVEQMRAELTAIREAEQNASRAGGVVHVADSALNEVGNLLNAIRGNVVTAAGGMLSDAELAANQLEVDAALEAINRIGSMTSYGGKKLLDGSSSELTFVFSPDVSDTSTLSLPNIAPSALGSEAGSLSELASRGSASLTSGDLTEAMDILDGAQSQVLNARATAGAFEKYTIESSQRLLDSMEVNLSAAVSSIFDTDVAAETSRLVRAQILVDATMTSLLVAGQRRGLVGELLGAL